MIDNERLNYIGIFLKKGIDQHCMISDPAWGDMVYMYYAMKDMYNELRKLRKELRNLEHAILVDAVTKLDDDIMKGTKNDQ